MIELDEEALEIAASAVKLEDEDFLDGDEATAIRMAQARKIVTSYMTELALKPSFANPIAHAAEIAEQRSDFWREKATVWAVQNLELSGRYQEAADACYEVAEKIRSSANVSPASQVKRG